MKNIDELVEQIHSVNAEQRRQECRPRRSATPRRAAAAALVAATVAAAAFLLKPKEAETPFVAHFAPPATAVKPAKPAAPPTTPQPPAEARRSKKEAPQPTPESTYAYSEIGGGIRVYCENQCDPQEAFDQVELVLASI